MGRTTICGLCFEGWSARQGNTPLVLMSKFTFTALRAGTCEDELQTLECKDLLTTQSGGEVADTTTRYCDLVRGGAVRKRNATRLDLDGKDIIRTHRCAFFDFQQLTSLRLADNHLTEIPTVSWVAGLRNLPNLTLSGNRIMYVGKEAFKGLDGLEELRLDGNDIGLIAPEGAFWGLPRLHTLRLGGNPKQACVPQRPPTVEKYDGPTPCAMMPSCDDQLLGLVCKDLLVTKYGSEVKGDFYEYCSYFPPNQRQPKKTSTRQILFTLDIIEVHRCAFHGFDNLQWLNLYDNQLSVLPPDVFKSLGSVEEIVLNGNRIQFIPPATFFGLSKLQRLYVYQNDLRTLEPVTFRDLSRLQTLYLGENVGLHCLPEAPPSTNPLVYYGPEPNGVALKWGTCNASEGNYSTWVPLAPSGSGTGDSGDSGSSSGNSGSSSGSSSSSNPTSSGISSAGGTGTFLEWAPEFNFVNGSWYVNGSVVNGTNNNGTNYTQSNYTAWRARFGSSSIGWENGEGPESKEECVRFLQSGTVLCKDLLMTPSATAVKHKDYCTHMFPGEGGAASGKAPASLVSLLPDKKGITRLDLMGLDITAIHACAFTGWDSLTYLYLQSNKIDAIPVAAVQSVAATLQLLWLDRNRLK